jgi:hypothetical protein
LGSTVVQRDRGTVKTESVRIAGNVEGRKKDKNEGRKTARKKKTKELHK